MSLLKVDELDVFYGDFHAVRGVSLKVDEAQTVAIIGANGAGKSTLLQAITGLNMQKRGAVTFDGKDIGRMRADLIARNGVTMVPEGRRLFGSLSVEDNLLVGGSSGRKGPWTLERVYTLFPRLRERANQAANTLSGGEQQMMVVGRALMTNPRLLILDEATEGLAPVIRAEIWACIEVLKKEGQSILLIDKNLQVLKRLADRHYIIEKGKTVWSGSGEDMNRDADLVHGYVGI